MKRILLLITVFSFTTAALSGKTMPEPDVTNKNILEEKGNVNVKLVDAGEGFSGTSVNTAVFRTNSVVTHGDTQYISYYDPEGFVTLGKRKLDSAEWEIHKTQYQGNVKDAHNVICIGVDGDGFLHAAFDHHGHPLHYAKSIAPGSLELGELSSMTGIDEENVTYPEFYSLTDGDLLFVYRSGASGRGNMAINRYDTKGKRWTRVQDSLIDGEEERSPYWQLYVDANDVIHVSWVWRETWLVETNHDLCYARSKDGGKSWEKSTGERYDLPITISNCEYACRIPQNSELINQTSMTADSESRPYIVSYWRNEDSQVPQYRLVWHDGESWHESQISHRTTPFSLSGGGTKMIPVARPRIVADKDFIGVIFRDEERDSKVSMLYYESEEKNALNFMTIQDNARKSEEINNDGMAEILNNIGKSEEMNGNRHVIDLTDFGVDAWEPSIDTELWKAHRKLHIFVQKAFQGDGEVALEKEPTKVYILETEF